MTAPSLFDLPPETPETPDSAHDLPESLPAHNATPVESGIAQTLALYRKYRPQSFDQDDLVGQEHVVQTLRNAIRLNRIGHAYLFCGPRGTGKTTTARLLAKAVNCQDPDPDVRPVRRLRLPASRSRGVAPPTSSRSTPPPIAVSMTSANCVNGSNTPRPCFAPSSTSSTRPTKSRAPRPMPFSRPWKSRLLTPSSFSPRPTRRNCWRPLCRAASDSTSAGSRSTR